MGSESQALIVQSKKIITHHHKGKHSCKKKNTRKSNKDLFKYICYRCDEIGHLARDCPRNKDISHKRKGKKKIHHSHAAEYDYPSKKRIKQDNDGSSSDEEYVLISSLMGTVTHGSNDWLIDSGASKHMMRFKESFLKLSEHESPTR